MRIVVVGPTFPFRGGIAHFTTLLVRHLRQRHAVVFYSYSRQYPRWLFPGSILPDPSVQPIQESCERTIDAPGCGMNGAEITRAQGATGWITNDPWA